MENRSGRNQWEGAGMKKAQAYDNVTTHKATVSHSFYRLPPATSGWNLSLDANSCTSQNSHLPVQGPSSHSPGQTTATAEMRPCYIPDFWKRNHPTIGWFPTSVIMTRTDPRDPPVSRQTSAFRESHQSRGHNGANRKEWSVTPFTYLITQWSVLINKS